MSRKEIQNRNYVLEHSSVSFFINEFISEHIYKNIYDYKFIKTLQIPLGEIKDDTSHSKRSPDQ